MAIQFLDLVASKRPIPTSSTDGFVDIDSMLESMLESVELVEVVDGVTNAIARRHAQNTQDSYRYWVERFMTWLGTPSTRWRGQDVPALREPSTVFPLDVRGFGLAAVWIQDMVFGPPPGHPKHADFEDDGPMAPGTLTIIGCALRAGSLAAGGDWVPPQRFAEFMRGQRRILGEQHRTVRARPLLQNELNQICVHLTSIRCPVQRRDWVVTELAGAGFTPVQIDRCILRSDGSRVSVEVDGVEATFDVASAVGTAVTGHLELIGPRIELTASNRRRHVSKILRRVAASAGVEVRRWDDPLQPGDAERMRRVVTSGMWSPTERAAVRDRALILTGWLAMLRRSELSALLPDDVPLSGSVVAVEIRRSKTDQYSHGATVNISGNHHLPDHLDPRHALTRWQQLRSLAGVAPDGPLFCTIDRHGNITGSVLSGDAIQKIIQRNVVAAGVASEDEAHLYRGHSLRRGAITTAADKEVDVATIQSMSRHKHATSVFTYVEAAAMRRSSVAERLGL